MAKILVVDDDVTTQLVLEHCLVLEGHQVLLAGDGEAGLALALEHCPQVVICDWMMPILDGLGLCQALKQQQGGSAPFFILVTAREQIDDRVRGLDAGADDLLAKPVEVPELLARVRAGLRVQAMNQTVRDSNQQLSQALKNLKRTQTRLVQSEKMSSLSQVVAGLAHEVNNPVTFIQGNLPHLRDYIEDLIGLVHQYQGELPQPSPTLQAKLAATDLDYLQSDCDRILNSIQSGSDRIRDIVHSLRSFSRLDEAGLKSVNLNEGIEQALRLLGHRFEANGRVGIQVRRQYANLPLVECCAQDVNQVFFHLIDNAVDALMERCDQDYDAISPLVRIETAATPTGVTVTIANNGPAIPANLQAQIFDPFFTTKPVGKGRGLGLAIAYQVAQQHSGSLVCHSEPNGETQFTFTLPAEPQVEAAAAWISTPDLPALETTPPR